MAILRRAGALLLLAMLCATLLALPVSATTTVSKTNGLEITAVTEKELYEPGEPITVTLTVKNTSSSVVSLSRLEELIPEGYKLSSGSKAAVSNVDLRPGASAKLEVTFEPEEKEPEEPQQEDFFHKLLYGETLGIPNLLLAVLLAIAFAIFMYLT